MKVGITMNDDLMHRIDEYCANNYLSRSGFLSLAANTYLNNELAIKAVFDLSVSMRQIADSNKINDEDVRKIEKIVATYKVLTEEAKKPM